MRAGFCRRTQGRPRRRPVPHFQRHPQPKHPRPKRPRALGKAGARDRVRTGDPQLGKLMLYQLSYSRVANESSARRGTRT